MNASALDRRALLGLSAASLGTLALSSQTTRATYRPGRTTAAAHLQATLAEPLALPALNYPTYALEPHIDELTMQIHHDKHHQAYIANLAKLVADHPVIAGLDPFEILLDFSLVPEAIRQSVRNNLGGHLNHSFFWKLMTPQSLDKSDQLTAAVNDAFGSTEKMQAAVSEAGLKRFGSGWTWLVWTGAKLDVISTPNQDNPIMDRTGVPVLGIDVWEHAYYLKYQNRRADYLSAWWNVCDWYAVSQIFAKVLANGMPDA